MFPNDVERCPGAMTEAGLDSLCVECQRREWVPGVLHPVGRPAVRWTLRYGRRCDKRKPATSPLSEQGA